MRRLIVCGTRIDVLFERELMLHKQRVFRPIKLAAGPHPEELKRDMSDMREAASADSRMMEDHRLTWLCFLLCFFFNRNRPLCIAVKLTPFRNFAISPSRSVPRPGTSKLAREAAICPSVRCFHPRTRAPDAEKKAARARPW